jgi:hypothetical protein
MHKLKTKQVRVGLRKIRGLRRFLATSRSGSGSMGAEEFGAQLEIQVAE